MTATPISRSPSAPVAATGPSGAAAGPATPSGPLAWFASEVDPQAASERSARFPKTGTEWLRFALVALQLALAAWVIDQFQIESRAFSRLFVLCGGGALVHALLPVRYRLAFFALLSFGAFPVVIGVVNAAWTIAIGLGLLALCHLPVSFRMRVALLVGAGAGLVVLRADWLHAPWPSAIWPVVGSLFMFRLIVYLYDRRHGGKPRSIWETVSYFFLLPNVCLPLFPVVDYATYRNRYYAEDAWQCSQTGLRWISRGLVHLLFYRLIYYYGVLAPSEVAGAGDIFRFTVTTFGLYLRVSGIFHMVVGMLRLFGFGLPETHFLYFESANANDFWRRANIYWKDFMQKVFFMPAYFKLRRRGETRAFVLATAWVVFNTWWLHSYQWFWLRSRFPLKWQDGFFWSVIGVVMVWNTLRDRRDVRARGRRVTGPGGWLGRAARVVATFLAIAFLWSLWTCETLTGWLAMWRTIGSDTEPATPPGTALAIVAFVFIVLVGGAAAARWFTDTGLAGDSARAFARGLTVTTGTLAGLLVLGTPAVYGALGDRISSMVQSLRVARLNRLDAEKLQRGYYEDLLDVDRFNSELWLAYKSKPRDWLELHETKALRPTDDFLLTELVPDSVAPYQGATLRTNRFGMRDREYELAKPANTWRAVLLGASIVMGSGVENEQTFEAILEESLNARGPGAPERRYEILNYSVGGYSPMQRLWAFEHKALEFRPDAAIYVAHEKEDYRLSRHLAAAHQRRLTLPYEELRWIQEEAGIDESMSAEAFDLRMQPFTRRIIDWTFRRFVATCRANGVRPLWVFLPTLEMTGKPKDVAWLTTLAREAGCDVIELFDVYDGQDLLEIRLADWDYHPNLLGHRIIADRLFQELTARPELLRAP